MSDFGEIRSDVESGDYHRMLGIYPRLAGKYQPWLFAKCPWMKPDGFGYLHDALVDVQQDQWFKIAAVVCIVLLASNEHREHWMRYSMASLNLCDNDHSNAGDVVWWMCSAANELHQRILDAGYECEWLLVVEFLAIFAAIELRRSPCSWGDSWGASPTISIETSFRLPLCRPYAGDSDESYFEDVIEKHESCECVESCACQDWSMDEHAWEMIVLDVERYGAIQSTAKAETVRCFYATDRIEISQALKQTKIRLGHL
jgi:hypothetical protein